MPYLATLESGSGTFVPSACPIDADELVDQYCAGTMEIDEWRAFDEHCRICTRCSEMARRTWDLVEALLG